MDKFDKLIFIGGSNFDKEDLRKNKRKISNDRDIKSLLRRGQLPLYTSLIGIIFLIFTLRDSIMNLVINFKDRSFVTIILLIIFYYWNIAQGVKNLSNNVFNLRQYLQYILSSKYPSNPLEIWNPITSSVSDGQTILTAERLLADDKDISFIYTGEPYYTIKYIDSITLKWDHNSYWNYIKHLYHYINLFNSHAIQTVVGHSEESHYKLESRELKVSSYVFGILYFSKYLNKIFGKENRNKIKIDFNKNLKEDKDISYLKEFIKSSSTKFDSTFENENNLDSNLTIHDVKYFEDLEENRGFSLFKNLKKKYQLLKEKKIRIPVKKYVALPKGDKILPKQIDFDDKSLVIPLGGAEQNLGLIQLINNYRWQNEEDYEIGIAENIFEDYRNTKFQIGTEELVYGVSNHLKGRKIDESDKGSAELFTFTTNDLRVLSIYGFSAPMTKIAACKFFEAFKKEDKLKDKLPWKNYKTKPNEIMIYEAVLNGQSFFGSDFLDYWDEKDVINENDEIEKLLSKLEIEIKFD